MIAAVVEPAPVTVVVVTYNSAELVPEFLQSLDLGMDGAGPWHLVIADNNSSDGTVSLVRELIPQASIIEMGRNAGYAAGLNAAVRSTATRGPVLVLNPDIRLQKGAVRLLLETLGAPGTGIAVPRLIDEHGRLIASLRREPTLPRAIGQSLLGGTWAGRWPLLLEEIHDKAQYSRPNTPDWASGAAMLLGRDCLEEVGPWDESYFLYSEETDFALRARDRGYLLRFEPRAEAVHLGGESHVSPWLFSLLTVNRVRLYRRRHGRIATAAFWFAVLVGELVRAMGGSPVHRASAFALINPRRVRLPQQ